MSTIVRGEKAKLRRHAAGVNGKPLCGGGNGARAVTFQTDMGGINCDVCLRLCVKQLNHNLVYDGALGRMVREL